MKHTPGPWREFMDTDSHDVMTLDGQHVALIEPVNEQFANARLVAAAPEMLEALEGFMQDYDNIRAGNIADVSHSIQQALPRFREAIAKAT